MAATAIAAPEIGGGYRQHMRGKVGAGFVPSLQDTQASGTAASVTLLADANRPNAVGQIFLSYAAAPTAGSIKIDFGAGPRATWGPFHILLGGLQSIEFNPPLEGITNEQVVVTLADGSQTKYLAVTAYKLS